MFELVGFFFGSCRMSDCSILKYEFSEVIYFFCSCYLFTDNCSCMACIDVVFPI